MNHISYTTRTILAAALVLGAAGRLAAQELFRLPVVGGVTENGATVAVWLASEGAIRVAYGIDPDLAAPTRTPIASATAASDNTAMIALSGLAPATRYYYRVTTGGGTAISPIQSFMTFPAAGIDAPVTILFGSCQQRNPTDTGRAFQVASRLGGDVFLQLGDWSYPDRRIPGYPTDEGTIREAYAQRLDTAYPFAAEVLSRMGLAYVWDDHDWTGNNSDGNKPADLKSRLNEAYRRYIPHYPLPNDAGVWHSFRIGNAEIFMIDSRSQRRPIDSAFPGGGFAPGPGHSMLAGYPVSGVDQRRWLLDAIRGSTARWKILATPVFFNPGAAPAINLALLIGRADLAKEVADKWAGYPEDLDSMKGLIAEGEARNMLVLSGDAHVNVYDDGTHSVIPEFMVGNLDINRADAFIEIESRGFDLWTELQKGTDRMVGRLRIETTPRHRLIVESFTADGVRELSYEMTDTTGPAAVDNPAGSARRSSVSIVDEGRTLRLELAAAVETPGRIELFDMRGRSVGVLSTKNLTAGASLLPLPSQLASGLYLIEVRTGADTLVFKEWVVR